MVDSDKNDPNKRQFLWEYSIEHICEFSAVVARNLAWQTLSNGNVHYHWLVVSSYSNQQTEERGKGFLLITKCSILKKHTSLKKKKKTFYYSTLFSSLKLYIHNINLIYNLSVRHIFVRHTNYMQDDSIFLFLPLVFDF